MSYSFTSQQQAEIDTYKAEIAAKSAALVTSQEELRTLLDDTQWVVNYSKKKQRIWATEPGEKETESAWDRELVRRTRFHKFFTDHGIPIHYKVDLVAISGQGGEFQGYIVSEINKQKFNGLESQTKQLHTDIEAARNSIRQICEIAVAEDL